MSRHHLDPYPEPHPSVSHREWMMNPTQSQVLQSRIKMTQLMKQQWPDLFGTASWYEFGCKEGYLSYALSRVSSEVWCWDWKTSWQTFVEAYPTDNLHWVKPHHVPTHTVTHEGGVLPSVYRYYNLDEWLTNKVQWFDSEWWVFRESQDDWVDPEWTFSLTTPGFRKTLELTQRVECLEVVDVFTETLSFNERETPYQWIRAKKRR